MESTQDVNPPFVQSIHTIYDTTHESPSTYLSYWIDCHIIAVLMFT